MQANPGVILFLIGVSLLVTSCTSAHTDVTVEEARDIINSKSDLLIVDVQEPSEYCYTGHIPGALNYPWDSGVLQAQYEELPTDAPILVVCSRGNRNDEAAIFLDSKGFSTVYDMLRGRRAWPLETELCIDGSGTADDPYRIATAADLIGLRWIRRGREEEPAHYILTADIDLDPNLPGRMVFSQPVIVTLEGMFDGNGHTISHLTVAANGSIWLGLFGYLTPGAEVRKLAVADLNVIGSGGSDFVGGLVGVNEGTITDCRSAGTVSGARWVGGLVGINWGSVAGCYSTGVVAGVEAVGGLVGENYGAVTTSYSTGAVRGERRVGGLAGWNSDSVSHCYSSAKVFGSVARSQDLGGLVGSNTGFVTACYSTGTVQGDRSAGGLVGSNTGGVADSFWDIQTSGQTTSDGGTGLSTAQMQAAETFFEWGGCEDQGVWTIDEGNDYPWLRWENQSGTPIAIHLSDLLTGSGTEDDPYLIYTAANLRTLGVTPCHWDKHFKLMADIDLSGYLYDRALIAPHANNELLDASWYWKFRGTPFTGVFDGNGHTISHLTIIADGHYLGLFGQLESGAGVKNLGVADVNVVGSDDSRYVGGVAGGSGGAITDCYCTGSLSGMDYVGGLVGGPCFDYFEGMISRSTHARIVASYSAATVAGNRSVGGLIGSNRHIIVASYSSGVVSGESNVGGFVGSNSGSIAACCSTAAVSGDDGVGGFAGGNAGSIATCYSAGRVTASERVGGFAGSSSPGSITACFWDIETSRQRASVGGTGRMSAEMWDMAVFLNEGWDFVGESNNGTCDYWQISAGACPRLRWETGDAPVMPEGLGTVGQPYLIRDAKDLGTLWLDPTAHYLLDASIDLSGITWPLAVVPWFGGIFDGDGHVISNLRIRGSGHLGLFGRLGGEATVAHLGLEAVEISGIGDNVGSLAGQVDTGNIVSSYSTGSIVGRDHVGGLAGGNDSGTVASSYSAGTITGNSEVGGLAGLNVGLINTSHSTATVTGRSDVGGLVGFNLGQSGSITSAYSAGTVKGTDGVGGLVGVNTGSINTSYSTGVVAGSERVGGLAGSSGAGDIVSSYSTGRVTGKSLVGGLVGYRYGDVTQSFWDTETSGLTSSDGGIGLTTDKMHTTTSFLDVGWDFIDETENGTDDIWWILEGQDYPRLWWELEDEESD